MTRKEIVTSLTNIQVIELVTGLGADRYKEEEKYIIFPTICHNLSPSDSNMKLYYYKENCAFKCYTECDGIFDIFELVRKRKELLGESSSYSDCGRYITKNVQVKETEFTVKQYTSKVKQYQKQENIQLPEYPKELLATFIDSPPPEWISEGISIESMRKFNILFSISENKAVIPHYDINERLVGIRGRSFELSELEADKKYMPVKIEGEYISHQVSLNLYGLNFSKENIKRFGIVILFEGEKSCIKYDTEFAYNISAAVCGSNLNRFQVQLLIRELQPREIVIAFDKQFTNWQTQEQYFNKLYKLCQTYSHYCQFSFIIDKKNLLEYKDAPIDRGGEIFLKLFKDRVMVNR